MADNFLAHFETSDPQKDGTPSGPNDTTFGERLKSAAQGERQNLSIRRGDAPHDEIDPLAVSEIRPHLSFLNGKIMDVHPKLVEEGGWKPPGAVLAPVEELNARRASRRRMNFRFFSF